MENCIFCKIANGEIPSNKVYEDDQVLAFYDLDPQGAGPCADHPQGPLRQHSLPFPAARTTRCPP